MAIEWVEQLCEKSGFRASDRELIRRLANDLYRANDLIRHLQANEYKKENEDLVKLVERLRGMLLEKEQALNECRESFSKLSNDELLGNNKRGRPKKNE